ncbi:unnamed protein product [marine sediment metagenome]|uniref:Formylmethanofuran dehydrogenase subunit E domain-containing protein n=1 Tax=marine sediment metagenome TaxID=412755 RepID=X1DXV3_9ZZZZ
MNIMMKVETPKKRELSKELLEKAIEFHGHGGPFMVIGLRMGVLALELLDAKGWFDLDCVVMLNWAPPDSCVIDGIQSSTGCTMGKRNIKVVEERGVAAEFTHKGNAIKIAVREDVLQMVSIVFEGDDKAVKEFMDWLARVDEKSLFNTRALF